MADAGSFNADLGINLQFNVDGAGLVEMSKTIKEISKGKDLQRYWKDVETATDNAGKAIERYSRNVNSQGLAENFLKQINALKAITKKENLSELFPSMNINFDELIESAKKVAPRISSEFSVSNFEQAFKTFDLLKDKGIELGEVFSKLADYANAVKRNSELSRENSEFRNLLGDDDIEKLKKDLGELQNLRLQAEREFESFLNINKIERTDFWGDEKFSEYFTEIRKGSMTATDAIARFKTEYAYLLEKSFKTNDNTFGIEQLQSFANKLDIIFHQVEETSNKINDIISNGVITKSVENLSVDSTLSDSQRSMFGNLLQDEESLKEITSLFKRLIEESNTVKNTTLFDEEQFNRLLILFEKIESSLSSMKAVIVDVGNGEEFSPLLKMIDNVQSSVKELSTSVSGIKLDVNMDLGSEVNERLNQKLSQSMNRQLEAYRNLFTAMKSTGKTNKEMLRFFEPDDASVSEIIGAYKGVIKRAEEQFGKDVYKNRIGKDAYSAYVKEIKNATDQFNRATNKKNAENPLGDLFGKTDLTEVVSQLNLIVEKLGEISTAATEFKNVFKDGFNVSASVEEIEKLTSRVKELEDELSKVKVSSTSPVETNISSGNEVVEAEQYKKISNDTVSVLTDIGKTEDQIVEKIQRERIEAEKNNEVLREHLVLLDKAGKVVANHWGSTNNVSGAFSEEQLQSAVGGKIIHAHPGKSSFFGGKDLTHLLNDAMYEQIKQVELIWGDSSLLVDKSTLTKQSKSTLLNIMRNVRTKLTEMYGDNPDGAPSREAKEHINAIEKEIFKSVAQKLNVSVSESGEQSKAVVDALSDVDKAIIRKFKGIEASVIQDINPSEIISSIPIKDTIQGDKIEQATTSAKELDKTLEQVDVPKESFDDVIAKFNIIEDKAKNIVKITKDMHRDSDGKPIESYNVTYKDGSNETYGESSNPQLLRGKDVLYDAKQADKEAKELLAVQEQITKEIEKQEKAQASAQKKKWQAFENEQKKYVSEQKKTADIEKNKSVYQELLDTIKQYNEVSKRIAKNETLDGDLELAQKLENKISELQKNPILSSSQIAKSERELVNLYNQLDTLEKSRTKSQKNSIKNDLKEYKNKLEKFKIKPEGSHRYPIYEENIDKLNAKLQEFEALQKSLAQKDIIDENDIASVNKLKEEIDELIFGMNNMSASEKGFDPLSLDKAIQKMEKDLREFTGMSQKAKSEIRTLINELSSDKPLRTTKEILHDYYEIIHAEQLAGRYGKSFLSIFKEKVVYGFAGQLASSFGIYDVINVLREGITVVREFDTALTEMRKVSDETVSSLERFQDVSFDLADSVGTTAEQIQNSTADYMRLGENLDEATESARVANILLNVSEFDSIDDATSSLVSMGQAYKDLDKIEIVDKLNEVGKQILPKHTVMYGAI